MRISIYITILLTCVLLANAIGVVYSQSASTSSKYCRVVTYNDNVLRPVRRIDGVLDPNFRVWCYGECAYGMVPIAYHKAALVNYPGAYRCCGSGMDPCRHIQNNDQRRNCVVANCALENRVPTCQNCALCVPPCTCTCNSCSAPSCPSGTSQTVSTCTAPSPTRDCGYTCNSPGCGSLTCTVSRACYYPRVNGANASCGTANGSIFSSKPTTGLCSRGQATGVTEHTDSYTWSCTGVSGSCGGSSGANASCSARRCRCWCNTCSPPASCPVPLVTQDTGCFNRNITRECGFSCNFGTCNSVSPCSSPNRACYNPPVPGRDATCGPLHTRGVLKGNVPSGTNACGSGSTRTITVNTVSAGTLNLIPSEKYTWTCIGENGTCTGPKGKDINCGSTICNCPCDCTNSVPKCPDGTSKTNTGDLCLVPGVRSLCTGTCNHTDCTEAICPSAYNNSCYVNEFAPELPTPQNMNMAITRRSGKTAASNLTATANRVPYPGNTGRSYDFQILFHQNSRSWPKDVFNGSNPMKIGWSKIGIPCVPPFCRWINLQGEVFKVYGQQPILTYSYALGSNAWSPLLGMSAKYAPNIQLSQGQTYTISAKASLPNRCQGSTESKVLTNRFKVNHKPEVLSIIPVANPSDNSWGADPNLRVSGNINLDASKYNMNNSAPGTDDTFDCTIDNPKYFEVTFRDKDGCADINPYIAPPTNTYNNFHISRALQLQAVNSSNRALFAVGTPLRNTVVCEPDGITLRITFEMTFRTNTNTHLNLEARVVDILGNKSYAGTSADPWRHPSGATWSYDARPPETMTIFVDAITGPQEIRLGWTAQDHISDLSGNRFVRTYGMLNPGTILRRARDYGPLTYDNIEVPVNEHFNVYHRMKDVQNHTPQLARDNMKTLSSGNYLIDIGKNQDGHLLFRVVSVDRACNYSLRDMAVSFELGSPWIATRGGFVYSDGPILFPNRNVNYNQILAGTSFGTETAAISSEWLGTLANNNQITGPRGVSYISPNYPNSITGGLYQTFYDIANRRDPGGNNWTSVNSDDLQEGHLQSTHLNKCKNGSHIYFINSSLEVNPAHYEDLGVNPGTGCIFLVRNNVVIGEGSYKSSGVTPGQKPGYDLVRGFFIVDGEINVDFSDKNKEVRDGLKVIGSLIAFDNPSGESSVRLRRSLQLRDNLSYPILIIFHDPRYMDIAREGFGSNLGGGYIRDVGFVE